MIHETDPTVPNLDIYGLMAATQWEWSNDPPELACPCSCCEEILVEAWERMTFSGCGVGSSYVNHETRKKGRLYTREAVRVIGRL